MRDFLQDHILDLLQEAYTLKSDNLVFGIWGTRKGVWMKLLENGERIKIKDKAHVEKLRGELQKYCVNDNTGQQTPRSSNHHKTHPTVVQPPTTRQHTLTAQPHGQTQQMGLNTHTIGYNGMPSTTLPQNICTLRLPDLPNIHPIGNDGILSNNAARLELDPNIQVYLAYQDALKSNQPSSGYFSNPNPRQVTDAGKIPRSHNETSNESFLSMESEGDAADGSRMVNAVDKLLKDQNQKHFGLAGKAELPLKCSTPNRESSKTNPFAGAWPETTALKPTQTHRESLSDRSYPTLPPSNPLSRGKAKTPLQISRPY